MGKLDGKIAVITGGSSGMGRATAEVFVREGAKVVITGRDKAALDATVSEIGGGVEAVCGDISSLADIDALRAHVETRHGRVDVLFANAGGGRPVPLEQISEEDFDAVSDTNFKGTFFTVQKLVPLMQAGSSIILTTSMQNEKGIPALGVYSATKAAIRSLARTFTAELGPLGIRVNALSPGLIDTPILRKAGLSEEMIEGIKTQMTAATPMRRVGAGSDIAMAALFLASSDSTYVAGIELTVDGGFAQI